MVRVAGLQEQLETNPSSLSPDGLTPATQLKLISERLRPLLKVQTDCLLHEILPGLEALGVQLVEYADVTDDQHQELERFFAERVFPVLTPLAVDPGHPFPYISNISLNLGILLGPADGSADNEPRFARVKIPPKVPRLVPVGETSFVLLEQLVSAHIESLFPRCVILECQPFRITRDADIEIEEDEAEDLLKSVEQTLRQRRFGFGVRLEVSSAMSEPMVDILRQSVQMEDQDVYSVDGPLNIPDLMALYKLNLPAAKDKPFEPATPPPVFREGETVFDVIRHQDVLLHHPYESFMPVVEFFRTAARDPNVLAIKATLYRVGSDSPIVKALIEAAERGKQVAVLVELKARFDEENNILWARRLEEAGAHVIFGIVGLKTHAKMTLVIRQDGPMLRRYVHLATGNYNPITARIYTDVCLFTAHPDFGADASDLFNFLTGFSGQTQYRKIVLAPVGLREYLTTLIRREVDHESAGRPAGIFAKFNSLTDTALIEELYAASAAGVPITLIVRGVCCLRPGVPGLSENIRVASIVGRFLEHSRVYLFSNGGNEELYLGSADLMYRNLNRRVEVMFPVEDVQQRKRARLELLENAIADNTKIRWLQPDGSFRRALPGDAELRNCQEELMAKY